MDIPRRTPSGYSEAALPTRHGVFRMRVYRDADGTEPIAITNGDLHRPDGVPVRVHSACFTAENLGSMRCDCREQLEFALSYIGKHGGAVIYLHQEGRGIGLAEKIRAYALQDQGYDTVEANHLLGFPADARSYETAALILKDLGIGSVKLMTNNPEKIAALRELGIRVVERIPVIVQATPHSEQYLATKHTRMGHLLHETTPDELAGDMLKMLAPRRAANGTANGTAK